MQLNTQFKIKHIKYLLYQNEGDKMFSIYPLVYLKQLQYIVTLLSGCQKSIKKLNLLLWDFILPLDVMGNAFWSYWEVF